MFGFCSKYSVEFEIMSFFLNDFGYCGVFYLFRILFKDYFGIFGVVNIFVIDLYCFINLIKGLF